MICSGDDGRWRNRRHRHTIDGGAGGEDVKAPNAIGEGGIEQRRQSTTGVGGKVVKMEQEAKATTASVAVDNTRGQ